MTELTRSFDIPIIFVSYPLQELSGLNRTIREAGRRLRVAVVNSSNDRERAVRDGHTAAELIDKSQGPHPSGLLYAYVVESMVPIVEEALASWHGFDSLRRASDE
jgi:hypothetical protein